MCCSFKSRPILRALMYCCIIAGITLSKAQLVIADSIVAAPGAGFDHTSSAEFYKGGVLAVSIPSQLDLENSRDFLPVVMKQSTDVGTLKTVKIYAYGEFLSANGTEPPVPVDLNALRSNLVLNLHFFTSQQALTASPIQGDQQFTVSLTNASFTQIHSVSNSSSIINTNVYEIIVDVPNGPTVTNGQTYALGANFTVVDQNGLPKVTTLMVRAVPSTGSIDSTVSSYFASRTNSVAVPTLTLLNQATSGRVAHVALAAYFVKTVSSIPPALTYAASGGNFIVSFRTAVEDPEHWKLLLSADLGSQIWTPISNNYRTIANGKATWTIPFSTLPPVSGFFKIAEE